MKYLIPRLYYISLITILFLSCKSRTLDSLKSNVKQGSGFNTNGGEVSHFDTRFRYSDINYLGVPTEVRLTGIKGQTQFYSNSNCGWCKCYLHDNPIKLGFKKCKKSAQGTFFTLLEVNIKDTYMIETYRGQCLYVGTIRPRDKAIGIYHAKCDVNNKEQLWKIKSDGIRRWNGGACLLKPYHDYFDYLKFYDNCAAIPYKVVFIHYTTPAESKYTKFKNHPEDTNSSGGNASILGNWNWSDGCDILEFNKDTNILKVKCQARDKSLKESSLDLNNCPIISRYDNGDLVCKNENVSKNYSLSQVMEMKLDTENIELNLPIEGGSKDVVLAFEDVNDNCSGGIGRMSLRYGYPAMVEVTVATEAPAEHVEVNPTSLELFPDEEKKIELKMTSCDKGTFNFKFTPNARAVCKEKTITFSSPDNYTLDLPTAFPGDTIKGYCSSVSGECVESFKCVQAEELQAEWQAEPSCLGKVITSHEVNGHKVEFNLPSGQMNETIDITRGRYGKNCKRIVWEDLTYTCEKTGLIKSEWKTSKNEFSTSNNCFIPNNKPQSDYIIYQ